MLASSWRIHDRARAAELHPQLRPGDVLVAERRFCSYAHLTQLRQQGVFVMLRIHQKQAVDFRPYRPTARPSTRA
jgi:hypothetical protein